MFYFEKKMMKSEYDKGLIHNVKLGADAYNGFIIALGGVAVDDVYSAAFTRAKGSAYDYPNYNGFVGTAPVAVTDKVYVLDAPLVKSLKSGDNIYRFGNETYGNVLPAGTMGRARELAVTDTFVLGDENFNGTPVVGQFAILEAGKHTLLPSVTEPVTEGFAVEILEAVGITTGAEIGFTGYVVRVIKD